MANGQHPEVVPTWTIRSVTLRTRDGPERLDQAYRRLLTAERPDTRPPGPDTPSAAPELSRVHDPRR
ncbi:MAG: hypothetical protein ACRYHQ_07305 [Janthinobacterium lividum]